MFWYLYSCRFCLDCRLCTGKGFGFAKDYFMSFDCINDDCTAIVTRGVNPEKKGGVMLRNKSIKPRQ
jgi:hypothetical protein